MYTKFETLINSWKISKDLKIQLTKIGSEQWFLLGLSWTSLAGGGGIYNHGSFPLCIMLENDGCNCMPRDMNVEVMLRDYHLEVQANPKMAQKKKCYF